MSRRIAQVNELILSELSGLIARHIDLANGLITLSYAKTDPDLRATRIGVSVLPETLSGTALKLLRSHSAAFSGELRKKLNLKKIPRFRYEIDPGERIRDEIIRTIDSLEHEEKNL